MKSLGRWVVALAMVVALTGFMALSAHAGLMGPSVSFDLTNFPGASLITSTLNAVGVTTVGDVQVFSLQLPTAGGGETDYFYFSTTGGSPPVVEPLAVNSDSLWEIDAHFTLSQAVYFDGYEFQWTTLDAPNGLGGTPVPLTSLNSGFIPFPGNGLLGPGYVNGYGATDNPLITSFSDPIAAGSNAFSTFVSIYSDAYTLGGIPTDANGFNIAYHFDPVPEPGTMLLFGSGLLGLAGWRRFRKG